MKISSLLAIGLVFSFSAHAHIVRQSCPSPYGQVADGHYVDGYLSPIGTYKNPCSQVRVHCEDGRLALNIYASCQDQDYSPAECLPGAMIPSFRNFSGTCIPDPIQCINGHWEDRPALSCSGN